MCGIAGVVSNSLSTLDREALVSKMLLTIQHRGPDDSGSSSFNNVTLGMVRLSIVDLASGSQPMKIQSCRKNLEIVFNGEIYNHKKLRAELHSIGHKFNTSHSDTEVILHAYEEWGDLAFSRLNGMFSISILDLDNLELTIARDAFGEKPLYLYSAKDTFAFASEVKALAGVFNLKGNFNFDVIENYLADGCNYSSNSFFQGVTKLESGSMAKLCFADNFDFSISRYQSYESDKSVQRLPINSNSVFEDLLLKSVEQRLDTDVETGIYLSGGLDSSAIAWVAHQLSPSIESFSVGFERERFNEANQARGLAEYLGIKNSQIVCDEKYAISFLDNLPKILDEPMADPSIIPTTLLSEFAAQKIKVALGGDGSDEIGYGYNTFIQFAKVDRLRKLVPASFIDFAASLTPVGNFKQKLHIASDLLRSNEPEMVARATSPLYRSRFNSEISLNFPAISSGISLYSPTNLFEDKLVDAYVSTYMKEQILVKIDRASMYSSVELRSPFLDYDLAAYMSRCEKKFKYSKGLGKLPLRAFLRGKVPNEILVRPKKGFGIPLNHWIKGKFGDVILEHIIGGDWSGTSLEGLKFEQFAKDIRSGDVSSAAVELLWALAVFQIWRQAWS